MSIELVEVPAQSFDTLTPSGCFANTRRGLEAGKLAKTYITHRAPDGDLASRPQPPR